MTTRANLHFISNSLDARITVVRVTTIQLEGEDTIYQFSRDQQLKEHHPTRFKTSIVKNVVKSMKIRGKFRNVRISLSDAMCNEYLIEEGNLCFYDQYLNEVQDYIVFKPFPSQISQSESAVKKSIHSVVESMVLKKFSGKNLNAKFFKTLN